MIFLLGPVKLIYKIIEFNRSLQKSSKIILGIDPGTLVMGYGIIAVNGNNVQLLEMSILKMNARKDNYERLEMIHSKITELILKHKPDCFAIEAPFFGKNIQSMLKLGRAQGVAMAAGLYRTIPIFEYSPKKIKQSITGNGNGSKEQVAAMLQTLLNFAEMPKYLDATDGLAAAVCHQFQGNKAMLSTKNYSGWKAFIVENPERKL